MRRVGQLGIAVATLALMVSSALAEKPESGEPGHRPKGGEGHHGPHHGGPHHMHHGMFMMGGMPKLMLLKNPSVQKDLKLTDEQVKSVDEAVKKGFQSLHELHTATLPERLRKMADLIEAGDKQAAEILKPEQDKRLKQITLQMRGPRALFDPEVAKELGLSDEQTKKLKETGQELRKEFAEAWKGAKGNHEEAHKKMQELHKSAHEKLASVLTDDQKAKWKEMTGEPFKGEFGHHDGHHDGHHKHPKEGGPEKPEGSKPEGSKPDKQ